MDDDLQIAIGFQDGFDPDDQKRFFMLPNDVKYALANNICCHALSVKICRTDSKAELYEDLEMPRYTVSSEIYDTDTVIVRRKNATYIKLAKYLVDEYNTMRQLLDKKELCFYYY